jgi:hypothetical protein
LLGKKLSREGEGGEEGRVGREGDGGGGRKMHIASDEMRTMNGAELRNKTHNDSHTKRRMMVVLGGICLL